MEKPPLFSIITVCYNEEKNIEKTAKSVVGQKFKNFEWVVIDGKSKDKTVSILNKYSKSMSYFVSEKDSGIYNAMNKGIKKAKGKYLLFLNGGDCFVNKDVLLKVAKFLEEDNFSSEIYYGNVLYDNGEKVDFKKAVLDRKFFLTKTISHQATFILKDLFKKYGNYEEKYKISSDFYFWLKAIVKGKVKTKFLPVFVSIFNLEGISAGKNSMKKHIEERHTILRENGLVSSFEIFYLKCYWNLIYFFKKIKVYSLFKKIYRSVVSR